MTWNDVAEVYPEFVQWIAQTQGPLPDGEVRKADFDKFAAKYREK